MTHWHHNFDKFYYKMIKRFFPKQEKFQDARTSLTQNSRMSPIRNPHLKNPTFQIHPQKKRRVSHARRPSHMTYTPRNKRTSKCDVHNKPLQLEALLVITHRFSKKEKHSQLSGNGDSASRQRRLKLSPTEPSVLSPMKLYLRSQYIF